VTDDYEIDDLPCPKCGHHVTHSRHCSNFHCQDGMEDLYEDDPVNESPGTFIGCGECCGTGIERWCPNCGADYWRAKEMVENENAGD